MKLRSTVLICLACAACAPLPGCTPIGPRSVARDRFEYSASIGESWKRQTLLNIVKIRYADPPIFVDVGQIVAGYSLETGVSIFGQVAKPGAGDQILGTEGSATFTDRPTITYTPLTGNRFIRSLMTPLTPESVFFTIQSGWAADAVLLATLTSLNGLRNQDATIHGATAADPDFHRAISLMRTLQQSGAVGMRVRIDGETKHTTLLTFRARDITPECLAQSAELRRLLRLDPETSEFRLVFAEVPADSTEIAVLTRSIIQLMGSMAAQVQVPPQDIAERRASPGFAPDDPSFIRSIRILSGPAAPDDAYVSVKYRGHHFWIDDRDLEAKRMFAFMMLLFTLSDHSEKDAAPLLTIPTQ